MNEATKRILSKSFLIVTIISIFFCFVIISSNKVAENNKKNTFERLVEDVIEVKIGEPIEFASVNHYFKSFSESSKANKYMFNFQKAYTLGGGTFDTNINYHNNLFVDENGNVIAKKTGVYKLEYSLSNYERANFMDKAIIDQEIFTFSNIIAVYENDYSDYAPFPYSDIKLFSDELGVEDYIITKDITLNKQQANELQKKANFGCIINPHGYTITIDTSLNLSGFIRQNDGILDGIKINYVSDRNSAINSDFYSLVDSNVGYIKNCEVNGSVYIDNNYKKIACLPLTGFVYNNSINLVINNDDKISAFDETAYAESPDRFKQLWKVKNNTVSLDAWYFTDEIKAARRAVQKNNFNGNIVKHLIFDGINYNEKHDVVLKLPLSITRTGETIYKEHTLNLYENSPIEISKDYWRNIKFGTTSYDANMPEVLHWIVDGVKYDNINEILVTKDMSIEPYVKFTQSYKSIDPHQGIVYQIFNADEDVVNISHYQGKDVDETLISSATISSLFDNPRAVLPAKIIMNRDCIINDDSSLFWIYNLPHIQRYMDNGGQFIIENGNSHYTMIQGNSLCSADGKKLLHYFSANDQEEIILHHQINSTGGKAFWNSQNIKKLDITNVETVDFVGLYDLQSLKEIKLGLSIKDTNNINNKFFLLQLPNLEVVNIDEDNPLYRVVDNFVILKNFNTLIFTPKNLEGTVVVPEGVKILNSNSLNGCKAEKVILPSTLTLFNESAFNYMFNLEEIVFGDSDTISGLSDTSVVGISNLKRISFSDITANINFTYQMFSKSMLEKIILPKNLTSFFMNNNTIEFEISEDNLTFVTVDGIVYKKNIYNNLKNLYLYPIYKQVDTIEVADDVGRISLFAFQNADLKTIILPSTLKYIDSRAFKNSKIEKIEIKSSNIEFHQESFWGCENLSEIILPENSTTYIYDDAFNGCKSLKYFDDTSVVYLGANSFANSGIESFEITDRITHFGISVFSYSDIKYFKVSSDLSEIPAFTFLQSKISTVDLGSVSSIGRDAFYLCTELKQINLKNTQNLEDNAFKLSGLTEIESDNIIGIGKESFFGCEDLKFVNFPNLITLRSGAFSGSAVETVHLPKLELLSEKTFYNCKFLTDLTLAPKIQFVDNNVFAGAKELKKIDSVITNLTQLSLNNSSLTVINLELGNKVIDYSIINNCINLKTINIKQIGSIDLRFSYNTFEYIKHPIDIYLDVYNFSWNGIISSNFSIYVPTNLFDEYYDLWLHNENIFAHDFTN